MVPFTASLRIYPVNGCWVYDDHRVVVENWHAELWLDAADSVATYLSGRDRLTRQPKLEPAFT
ncbi:hypothetical protein FB157_1493 [Streptomyces sp. BK340]|nr:hypothetical protein FB157_1493 [Streptomyces sp. BK340]